MGSIIEVKNLSKSFIISHEGKERYTAMRDVLASKAKKIFSFPSSYTSSKNTASKEEFWALKDVSFEIKKGDRVGIIGRNGAGKSTLLKILSRISEPTSGEIKIKGRVASLLEVGTGFHPELTGRENVFLNGAILGMSQQEIRKHFDEIVDFAEVEKFLDTPVKRYSSGMYVRLAFAVAAHLEPEILIVDEVLAVGDAQFQKKCLGKMEYASSNEGRTVLFVSHNMGVVKHLCNKGVLFSEGRIREIGNIQTVINAYSDDFSGKTVEIYNHIQGSQELSIEKIVFNNLKGGIDIFEPIDISILYKVNSTQKKIDYFTFFLLIYNYEGEVVWSLFQKDSYSFCTEPSKSIKVKFENVLLPGNYFISAGIFNRSGQFIDWVDKVETFEILSVFHNGENFDNRLGLISTKAEWILC